jgi:hypothetical protein
LTGRLNLLAVRGNWEYYRALHFLFNAFALRGAYRDGSRPKASSLQAVRPMAALGANADVRYGSLADITAATRSPLCGNRGTGTGGSKVQTEGPTRMT